MPIPVSAETDVLARRPAANVVEAGLDCGDCFADAPAADTGGPLLFKGDDVPRTDLAPAWAPAWAPA